VNDTHYVTFEPLQGMLGLSDGDDEPVRPRGSKLFEGDELRPGVHAEH